MIALAAGELAGTRLLSGDPATRIESVVTDSRAAGPGALFCALEGERSDGHDFLDDVRAAGAVAVLCRTGRSRPLAGVCVLEADEPLTALGAIARQVRRAWGGKVIGIAGSNGKTSTKDMLAALCAPHVPTLATHRNHNNRLGLPLTLFRLEPRHALCICELGTSEVGELADLAAIAEPDIGVITNIAPEHLEFLGDLEGVAREEASLLAALPPGGDAVLPVDEPLLAPYRRSDVRTTTFGEPGGDVRCLAWEPGAGGTRAVLDVLGERAELRRAAAAPPTTPPTWPRPPRRTSAPACRSPAGRRRGVDRALAAARAGAGAARRRRARERRLQRQSRLGRERAGRARRARRGRAHGRRARPHGRARAGGAALARRGRARLRAARHRRRDRRGRARGRPTRRPPRAASGTGRPTSPRRRSCCRASCGPGDVVLLKGSRSAGIERLAEVAL